MTVFAISMAGLHSVRRENKTTETVRSFYEQANVEIDAAEKAREVGDLYKSHLHLESAKKLMADGDRIQLKNQP